MPNIPCRIKNELDFQASITVPGPFILDTVDKYTLAISTRNVKLDKVMVVVPMDPPTPVENPCDPTELIEVDSIKIAYLQISGGILYNIAVKGLETNAFNNDDQNFLPGENWMSVYSEMQIPDDMYIDYSDAEEILDKANLDITVTMVIISIETLETNDDEEKIIHIRGSLELGYNRP